MHVFIQSNIIVQFKRNPYANIVAVDYDPGASDVNQLNRIKLMMSTAHRNLQKKIEEEKAVLDNQEAI